MIVMPRSLIPCRYFCKYSSTRTGSGGASRMRARHGAKTATSPPSSSLLKLSDTFGSRSMCWSFALPRWLKIRKVSPSQWNQTGRACAAFPASTLVSQMTFSRFRRPLTWRPNFELKSSTAPLPSPDASSAGRGVAILRWFPGGARPFQIRSVLVYHRLLNFRRFATARLRAITGNGFMEYRTDDLRIKEIKELLTPEKLLGEFPIAAKAAQTVFETRRAIHRILHGADDRLLVIMGPCSIHDVKAAADYAAKMKKAKDRLAQDLLIVMRVYFEKPRTTVGWKGLINDPNRDGSFQINHGLRIPRRLLLHLP